MHTLHAFRKTIALKWLDFWGRWQRANLEGTCPPDSGGNGVVSCLVLYV